MAAPIDFGPQPMSNRFLKDHSEPEYRHSLQMSACAGCGVVQLLDPPPPVELKARFSWIFYNEAEGHLDALVERLAALPGVGKDARVGALTYKDDSTLTRLQGRGISSTLRLDPMKDLGLTDDTAGIETLQALVDPNRMKEVVKKHGAMDVVIARHVLEHAQNVHQFVDGLKTWLKPGGRLVFEVPDCRRALERKDYSTLWEEHVCYFTPETLQSGLKRMGFEIEWFQLYPYSLENSLVVVVKSTAGKTAPAIDTKVDIARFEQFSNGYKTKKDETQRFFAAQRKSGKKIALLGAGHLSCTYINLLGVAEFIDCVIDDNPHKIGLLMPGSRLPIVGSQALYDKNIDLCLMSVNPETEPKILAKNEAFVKKGGMFASIFPDSVYAMKGDSR